MTAAEKVLEWMKKFYEVNGTPNYGEIIAQLEMAIKEEKQGEKLPIHSAMHRFYMQIAKDHSVPTDRILLAITDNGKDVQAYSTNLEETEITYLQDYSLLNGA